VAIRDLFIGDPEGVPDWTVGRELVFLLFERPEGMPRVSLQKGGVRILLWYFLKIIASFLIEGRGIIRAHP
jgi:hypothetical protein